MEEKCLSSVLWLILLHSYISAVHCECGLPPKIPYGVLKPEFADQIHFAVGSTVKYDCQPGFIRTPETKNDVTCLEDFSWSSYDEFCQLRSCEFPGEIENGYLEVKNFFFGSRVTYRCKLGFHMVSKHSYRECQADGTWSNSLPSCQVNFPGAFCPEPKLSNGKVKQGKKTDGYSVSNSVTLECDLQYKLNGESRVTCGEDFQWYPQLPTCELVNFPGEFCPEPKLLNGKVKRGKKTDGYSVGNSVTLECDLQYKLNGASKVTCGEDFQWYPQLPTCELGTFCPEPKLINGRIVQGKKTYGYSEFDSITVACNSGYKLNGAKRVQCQRNFQWSEFPICELEKGCRSPKIANGRITQKNGIRYDPEIDGHGFSALDVVEIMCDSGYRLQGSSQSTCNNKTWYYFDNKYVWSPELPTCEYLNSR